MCRKLSLFLDLPRTLDEAILTVNQEPELSYIRESFYLCCVVITVIGIGSD